MDNETPQGVSDEWSPIPWCKLERYLYSSPFAQSTPHILNFKLPVEMSTQPQALQDCFLQP